MNDSLVYALVILDLLISSVIDIKKHYVYSVLNYLLILLSFMLYPFEFKRLLVASIIPAVLLVIYNLNKNIFGLGDIELIFALNLYCDFYHQNLYLLLSSFSALLWLFFYSLYTKRIVKEPIAFIPFLTIAFVIVKLL